MTELDLDAIEAQLPHDARMAAYFYHFKRTGAGLVDAILSAVAVAGKGAQRTEYWDSFDTCGYYSNRPGLPNEANSAVDLIQRTANRSAEQVIALIDEMRRLQAQAEQVKALHKRAHAVGTRTGLRYEDPCPDCDGKKGAHDCGCWGAFDTEFVCAECHRLGSGAKGVYDYTYPCPTIKALGGDGE